MEKVKPSESGKYVTTCRGRCILWRSHYRSHMQLVCFLLSPEMIHLHVLI